MPTILDLERSKALSRFIPALRPQEQEFRRLSAAPRFQKWVLDELPNLDSNWNLDVKPIHQLDDFLNYYSTGGPLTFLRQFSPIHYRGQGVWELKTADVRVFGWFHKQDWFIAVLGDMAWRVKEFGLYKSHGKAVVDFRNKLPLDEPKFVQGKDPKNVVSNFLAPA
jgi:hypothetical protein